MEGRPGAAPAPGKVVALRCLDDRAVADIAVIIARRRWSSLLEGARDMGAAAGEDVGPGRDGLCMGEHGRRRAEPVTLISGEAASGLVPGRQSSGEARGAVGVGDVLVDADKGSEHAARTRVASG